MSTTWLEFLNRLDIDPAYKLELAAQTYIDRRPGLTPTYREMWEHLVMFSRERAPSADRPFIRETLPTVTPYNNELGTLLWEAWGWPDHGLFSCLHLYLTEDHSAYGNNKGIHLEQMLILARSWVDERQGINNGTGEELWTSKLQFKGKR